jgi:hypothetical protein
MKSFVALALAFLPAVFSHGSVHVLTVDGTPYDGPAIAQEGLDSVVRMISTMNPVTDPTSSDLTCGQGVVANGVTAKLSAAAKPGSTVSFSWISGNAGANWPHNMGPMMTYLASCGTTDCSQFDAQNAKWVKIGEAGYVQNATIAAAGSTWTMATTAYVAKPYTLTLPKNLANGNYLIRHEIIALHRAVTAGGAEFYPSCQQITVTGGSGSGISFDNAVTFPGAYKATDPGILIDVYTPSNEYYQFPGPALVTDAVSDTTQGTTDTTGGSDNTSTIATPLTSNTNSTQPASSTSAPSTASEDCPDDDNTDGAGDSNATVTITSTITVTVTATDGAATTTSGTTVLNRMRRVPVHHKKHF